MGKIIKELLSPKKEGLRASNKPIALLVHSPHDTPNASIDYAAAHKWLKEKGYGSLNKGKLMFDSLDSASFQEKIKGVKMQGRPLTIWLESHGAPGWLFGENRDAEDEFRWTERFADFVHAVEVYASAKVTNVVLSGCFTANEFINMSNSITYMNSPARMLSLLLPNVNVVGFVGQNANAKVTHVYRKMPDNSFKAVIVNPENAAIMFRNGSAFEAYDAVKEPLYSTHQYTPSFIIKSCGLDLPENMKQSTYYQPCLAREELNASAIPVPIDCYGEKQWKAAHKATKSKKRDQGPIHFHI